MFRLRNEIVHFGSLAVLTYTSVLDPWLCVTGFHRVCPCEEEFLAVIIDVLKSIHLEIPVFCIYKIVNKVFWIFILKEN
jgi:hypothetical protein